LFLWRQPVVLAERHGQHGEQGQLGGEGLRRGYTNFPAGKGQEGDVGFAHQGTVGDVAHRKRGRITQLLRVTQRGHGVGCFTGLRNGYKQAVVGDQHLAVAELAGDVDGAGKAGYALDPELRDEAGMVAGTAGHDLHAADRIEYVEGVDANRLFQKLRASHAALQGVADHFRLFEDFLLQEVAVLAHHHLFVVEAQAYGFARDRLITVVDGDVVAADFGDVTFLQVDEAVRNL